VTGCDDIRLLAAMKSWQHFLNLRGYARIALSTLLGDDVIEIRTCVADIGRENDGAAPYPERERADHLRSSTSKSHARVLAAY
jgi:hypothetical protein